MFKEDTIERIRELKHDADRLRALKHWYDRMSSPPECLWHDASFGRAGDAGSLWGITCISFTCSVALPSSNAFPPALESGEAVTRAFIAVLNDCKWSIIARMADYLMEEANGIRQSAELEIKEAQELLESVRQEAPHED